MERVAKSIGRGTHLVGHGGVVTTRSKWQDLPGDVPTRQVVRLGTNRAERRRHAKRVLATAGASARGRPESGGHRRTGGDGASALGSRKSR